MNPITGQSQPAGTEKSKQFVRAVASAGAAAGALDISVAFINYFLSTGKNPVIVLHYIASSVFGQDAYTEGFLMPLAGLTFHFMIASSWAALFFFAYPKVKFLSGNSFIAGAAYGLFIWLTMNLVVLPLSRVHQFPFDPGRAVEGAAILIVCVGLPISFFGPQVLFEKRKRITMKTTVNPIESALGIFRQYKTLAENAMAQISDEDFFKLPEPESNSIAIIVKHMSGNMRSRFTDFLTTDGEEEWRNRDSEFEMEKMNRNEVMAVWERGWQTLFNAIEPLTQEDLKRTITIRNEPHSVLEAINRAVAHLSYHVGQIVFLAKMYTSGAWQTLTIPKRKQQ